MDNRRRSSKKRKLRKPAVFALSAVVMLAVVGVVCLIAIGQNEPQPVAGVVTTAKSTSLTTAQTTSSQTVAVQTTTKTTEEETEENKTEINTTSSAATNSPKKTDAATSSSKPNYTTALNNYVALFSSVPSSGSVTRDSEDMTIGYQILVNNKYAYNTEQSQDIMLMTNLDNRSFTVAYTDLDADRFTLKQFNQMNRTFYNKYGYKLNVCSGYRSYASQKRLFDNSVERSGEEETLKWYTRPGHSEHHTGFSIDYNTNSFGSSAFTGTGNEAWIKNNCDDYGFVLRYTADKKPITGVAAEAWHFRQVGIPHARYIMQNGLCLEEYIDKVKSFTYDNPLSVKTAKSEYTFYIWYVPLGDNDSANIKLSGYSKYYVSGNNVDGFVVTAIK